MTQFYHLPTGGIEGTRGRTRRNSNSPAHRSKEATTAAPRTTTTTPWQIWVEIRRLRYADHIIDTYHISHMLMSTVQIALCDYLWTRLSDKSYYLLVLVTAIYILILPLRVPLINHVLISQAPSSASSSTSIKKPSADSISRRKDEGSFTCDGADCGYRSKFRSNLVRHCQRLSHYSAYLAKTAREVDDIFSLVVH